MSTARHPKSKVIQWQRLFAGLKNFSELEQRITGLPDEKSRGDAFEVFAEAYLATQRKHDAAQVWPLPSASFELLQSVGLASKDYGVDGILQTTLGQLNVYQVKFRTDRRPLSWRELSTFMGLTDSRNIRTRILFTNCDELPEEILKLRRAFFPIRGADLDRLEARDFVEIENWLGSVVGPVEKKSPKPYQQEALNALLPALREHDRVSAIMACGTGKTLVALWVSEQMGVSKILVLLPSLALVRQALHEWLHETRLPSLPYLCVCSDPTVNHDLDAIVTPQSDLDFEVTTNTSKVREFMDAPFDGVRVVFSTYQSAHVVGGALRKGERFDLGIFDEAHKTAGREGRNFAFALEDKNLPIRQRLFLTATPRHYNPLCKNKEGDAQLVFSMDDPEVYGPQAYRLTFAEAARRRIICNYKVIISVITSETVTNELLSCGEVLVKGDVIRARHVANQLALKDAVVKYGVNKIFTFHSTVKSGASFTCDGPEGIRTHLATAAATSRFKTFHVNGAMPTAQRERIIGPNGDFRKCDCGIVSSVRCLTEGVDVPAVDMVAFLSPRRSRVDIVQATGRAMRRSSGKTTGYVLVPLYVEQAARESIEEAVSRARFDDVWEVLQAMQEQDEVFAEIIGEMREERGRTKGFNDARIREKVEILGPGLLLETLRRAIITQCIEKLGASWDEWFGVLEAFKEKHESCDVGCHRNEYSELWTWLSWQRRRWKRGELEAERERKLAGIGVDLDPNESVWQKFYSELVEAKQKLGYCNVPRHWPESPGLGQWLAEQRKRKKSGKLSVARIEKLERLGVVWDKSENQWEERFSELLEAAKKSGTPNLSRSRPGNPRLAAWVHAQRVKRRKGQLDNEKARRLENLGLIWNPFEADWEEHFSELIAFKNKLGHCDVPRSARCARLGKWLSHQRSYFKRGKLEPRKIERLNKLGMIWDLEELRWDRWYLRLTEFKKQHGHCNVTQGNPKHGGLAQWLNAQRRYKRRGKLEAQRMTKLDALGVDWNPMSGAWDELFAKLAAFKKKFGHCNPTAGTCDDERLVNWVYRQRQVRKKGRLTNAQGRQLKQIGFEWMESSRKPS